MPLPTDKDTPWPPLGWRAAYIRFQEWSAWYSGTPAELTRFYANYMGQDRSGFFDSASTAQPYNTIWQRFKFWGRQQPGAITRIRSHVPLPADMATISSDLIFADAPRILIPDAHMAQASSSAKDAQDRLDEIIDADGIMATLLEGGEVCAALGGVYPRISWDKEFASHPLLTIVHPDAVVPDFLYGKLIAATVWRVVLDNGKDVWRQLERYEMVGSTAHIITGLYMGTREKIGTLKPLNLMPETSSLVNTMTDPQNLPQQLLSDVDTGLSRIPITYVPNMRPNRADRTSPLGRSDFQGVEGLFDSLDETMTSWMRDIRLGKARLIAPEEYMAPQKRGQGSYFDLDREIWETLKMHPSDSSITPQQFSIRTQEHADTIEALIERIVSASGYSGATFGLKGPENLEKTATEVRSKEQRTLSTRDRKIGYWRSALADIFELMLEADQAQFGGSGTFRPILEFSDTVQASLIDTANAVNFLEQAKAVSLRTKVQMVHPDWDPGMIDAEVKAIQGEQTAAASLSIATAAAGKPEPAPAANPTAGGGQPATEPHLNEPTPVEKPASAAAPKPSQQPLPPAISQSRS